MPLYRAREQKWTVLGNAGNSKTIDWSISRAQHLTLDTSTTLTFQGQEAGGRYALALLQPAAGSKTVTWPASVRHSGGTAPTLTVTASKTDYIGFIYNDSDAKFDLVSFAPNY